MSVFHVRFADLSEADANRAALELRDAIDSAAGKQVQTSIVKERQDTQDFGATLVLVLGTEVAMTVAKAIYNYVSKRGDKVLIETEGGKVLATGSAAANIDVPATASALRAEMHEQ
jgi:hypothetical protein